jgi:hypothetical protein
MYSPYTQKDIATQTTYHEQKTDCSFMIHDSRGKVNNQRGRSHRTCAANYTKNETINPKPRIMRSITALTKIFHPSVGGSSGGSCLFAIARNTAAYSAIGLVNNAYIRMMPYAAKSGNGGISVVATMNHNHSFVNTNARASPWRIDSRIEPKN